MKKFLVSLIFASIVMVGSSMPVVAIDITPKNCAAINKAECKLIDENKLDSSNGRPSALKSGLNIAFIILGMISVLMIVIGGFKYTASNGDASLVSSAKNTILYAVIGLVVAGLSFALVNTVIEFL